MATAWLNFCCADKLQETTKLTSPIFDPSFGWDLFEPRQSSPKAIPKPPILLEDRYACGLPIRIWLEDL